MPLFKSVGVFKLTRVLESKGFSLVELLIAIGIIGMLGAVAVPALRDFSKVQEVDNAAQQLENVIKTAHSSAASRIVCPRGTVTDAWYVRVTSNNYTLFARCKTPPDQQVATYFYTPAGSSTITASNDVCPGLTFDVIFSKNQVSYLCFGNTVPVSGDIRITLQNSSAGASKVVRIERGGVIKIE